MTKAVATIAKHQSASGGWWYVQGSPQDHEGSTTVCAVQALVSAANFGIPIDEAVLAKGFEYLRRCQNPDGGFDYKEGPGTVSMKEGTAGDVATLALMRKFDYQVMTRGVDFLKAVGPAGISAERFPYYGHFYASMGLVLFGEEMGAERVAAAYFEAARRDVLAWQAEDGSWPLKGWMQGRSQDTAYGTAFAALFLAVPEKRLSIFHRRPPVLPKPSCRGRVGRTTRAASPFTTGERSPRVAMRWIASVVAAAVLLGGPAAARAEPETEPGARLAALRSRQVALIRPLLASGDDRQVAWGATWARELSLTDLVPDLVALVRDEAQDDEAVGYYGMLAVFDALIHLDAMIEGEALRPFLERRHGFGHDHKAAAIVLAVRSGNPHTLLELFDVLDRDGKSWEEGWLALGNVLASSGVAGFAMRLVQGIEIDVEITVRDPGRHGGGSRDLGIGSGDGRLPECEGYPRIWRYDLTERPRTGDLLLADGPRPIFLRRREAQRGFGSTRRTPDRTRDRLAWIAGLVGTQVDELPLERRYGRTVAWSTPEAYLASVRGLQVQIASDFAQTVQRLVATGHLAAHEAEALRPRMHLEVRDKREDPSVPLPPLPDAER